jgi:uncharacterized protein YndB with AHSA1/START domain
MANSTGYVYEHRLVLAAALGRFLCTDEHVHHIDGDPLNNAPENLIVVTAGQHGKIHRLLDKGLGPREVLEQVIGGTA